jgi:hypothetical protein
VINPDDTSSGGSRAPWENDDTTDPNASDWTPAPTDSRLMPWETCPGIVDDWRTAEYAIADGVQLYLAPDTPEVAKHNAAVMNAWHEQRRAARERWRATADQSGDRLRKRAVGLLGWKHDKLAATAEGTRDDDTARAIWYLAGLVNDGHLHADEVRTAIVSASQANGHIPGNKSAEQVRKDVDRGLGNARHGFDWDRMTERPGWGPDDYEADEPVEQFIRERNRAKASGKAETNGQASESDDDGTPVLADLLLTRSDLRNLRDPEPLIDNVLDQGTTALLYGKWGTAKTFTALDWAASVATGHAWQGRKTVQRRVLYALGEGAFGFKGRVQAWEVGWQTKISDERLSILPVPVNLTNTMDVLNLMALVDWGGYDFVILDTLARCMVGADENSAEDMGVVVDTLTRLLAHTPNGRGVVLGVHHTGKDGKTSRGSSALEGGVDTVYFTSRDEGHISLTREKRKDGPEMDSHLLKLDPIEGTGSCCLSSSHLSETTSRTATLRLIMSQHFRLSGATSTQLRQLAVDDGPMSRAAFYRAVDDLLESGWLINTGTARRPFYFIKD